MIVIDGEYTGILRFRDAARAESRPLVSHLGPRHQFDRFMIVSGDRESEVRYLADQVGITEIHAEKIPEEKLAIVRSETALAKTLYVGDGINDAPAMMAAPVGMAIGRNSDVTAQAAGVVGSSHQIHFATQIKKPFSASCSQTKLHLLEIKRSIYLFF